ncbi:MAG: ATP-grasp domain-containing protein [Planctomycetia bacterium]|nr:ATP-grasp domain-containing protein [Planctomycetia bacterium]
MVTAVLVAPFFQENTVRYVRALVALEGARPCVITQDDVGRLPPEVRAGLAGHRRVADALDADALAAACRSLAAEVGPVDRLFGVLEQLQAPVARARDLAGVPGMSAEIVRGFRDKARMKEVLRAAGLPVARSRLLASAEDGRAFAREVGFPVVVKPPDGLGAKATYRARDAAGLEEALAALAPSPARPVQAEEFVTGDELTFETVSVRGRPVWWSGTRYLPGPLTVIENPWIQYCVLLPREEDAPDFTAFVPTGLAALKALGMGTGLTHMEWFRRADGSAVVSEVGARPPGVHIMPMMSLAHGLDMIPAWVRLVVHETFDPPRRRAAAGAAFLRSQGQGTRVAAVTGLDEVVAGLGDVVVEVNAPRVGQPVAEGYEGEGHVLVCAPRTETVREALAAIVGRVRVRRG